MTRDAFEQLVDEGMDIIPERFRRMIRNVAVLVEDEPSADVREQEGLADGDTLLGYYHGVPHTERGQEYGVGEIMPDTITIYQNPIEEEAGGDPDEIRRIVADTVWHEFAHHFGLDEDAVRVREQERGVWPPNTERD